MIHKRGYAMNGESCCECGASLREGEAVVEMWSRSLGKMVGKKHWNYKTCKNNLKIGDKEMNTYEIVEDNGGGLTLYVFDGGGNVIDGIYDLAYAQPGEYDQVRAGLATDPLAEIAGWDGHIDSPQDDYHRITNYDCGWVIVCNNGTLYPDAMGAAAQKYFFGQ